MMLGFGLEIGRENTILSDKYKNGIFVPRGWDQVVLVQLDRTYNHECR